MAHRSNQHFRAMSVAIGAVVSVLMLASAGICEASYSAETPISKPSIDTPSFEPFWETDTVHELSASGASPLQIKILYSSLLSATTMAF
jgi:hypothetical protein